MQKITTIVYLDYTNCKTYLHFAILQANLPRVRLFL